MAKPTSTTNTASTEALSAEAILAAINKECGAESINILGSKKAVKLPAMSTGLLSADIMLGIGGLPISRVIEIYGPESSGKTTFCLNVVAEVQRKGGTAAFIDVEHALDPKQAKTIGVNLDKLMISQPESGEHALRICESLVKLNAIDIIVLDSVAALVSQQELDGSIGDSAPGAQARLMSQAMRRLVGVLARSPRTVVIFTNQIREKIGVMFGNPETTPGGRALKFFSSVRIDIRRKDAIKDSAGNHIGNRVKLKAVKNKVAAPYRECEMDLLFSEGFSKNFTLIDEGIERKVLTKKGAWICFNGEMIGNGRGGAKAELDKNADLAEKIRQCIVAQVESEQAPAPASPELAPSAEAELEGSSGTGSDVLPVIAAVG